MTAFARGADGALYVQRYSGTWPGWGQLGGVPLASAPAALSAPEITSAPVSSSGVLGFDTCGAPLLSAMQTWRLFSPYTSIGIYIGGISRGAATRCSTPPHG